MLKRLFLTLWAGILYLNAQCQELTIYVIAPNMPMNWKSPQALLLSYAGNLLARNAYAGRRHPMGHLIVELKDSASCSLVGIVAKSKKDLARKVSVEGYGLGVLLAPHAGRMQTEPDNRWEIDKRCKNGDVAFIKFKINYTAFAKLKQYLEEYKERGYDKIYNGENKPREGKGAGCSAFGVSFIEIAGLLPNDELARWIITVNIPDKLIGGPGANNRWVGLHKILFKRKWADTCKHHYKTIAYYEPSLMYAWIKTQWRQADTGKYHYYSKEMIGSAEGLIIDCTRYSVPPGPIWIDRQVAASHTR